MFVTTQSQCGWWDLTDGRFSASPIPHPLDVSFAANGRRGLAVSLDGLFRVFDAGSPTLVAETAWGQNADYRTAISPDGTQVLMGTADGTIHRFALGRGAARPLVLPRTRTPVVSLAPFLPEPPARLLWLDRDHAKIIQVASGREIPGGFRYPEPILAPLSFDTHSPIRPDLKFMVVRTESGAWQSWELGPGGVQRAVPLQNAPGRDGTITFSAHGDLASISDPMQIWNLRTGEPIGPPLSYSADFMGFGRSFSPDAKRFGIGAADGAALIFDPVTARPVIRLKTPPLVATRTVQFSADGERVVTANVSGENRLWNAHTGEPISPPIRMTTTGTNGGAIFSPDGRWLAIWNNEAVMLADGRTGVAVGKIIPSGGKLVGFSADGNRLGTAAREGNAQVWDVPSGDAVTEPLWHQPLHSNLPEFSPDGRFLKTENVNFNLWAVPPALPRGTPPPEWLLELATLCAGKVVNDAGELVPAMEAAKNVERLRRDIATLPADAPLAEWGRWLLDDSPDRPIAPGFTITPAEAAKLAADTDAARP